MEENKNIKELLQDFLKKDDRFNINTSQELLKYNEKHKDNPLDFNIPTLSNPHLTSNTYTEEQKDIIILAVLYNAHFPEHSIDVNSLTNEKENHEQHFENLLKEQGVTVDNFDELSKSSNNILIENLQLEMNRITEDPEFSKHKDYYNELVQLYNKKEDERIESKYSESERNMFESIKENTLKNVKLPASTVGDKIIINSIPEVSEKQFKNVDLKDIKLPDESTMKQTQEDFEKHLEEAKNNPNFNQEEDARIENTLDSIIANKIKETMEEKATITNQKPEPEKGETR